MRQLVHVVAAIGDAAAVVVFVVAAIVIVWLKILNFPCVYLEIERER
jgi:hypothetical protein